MHKTYFGSVQMTEEDRTYQGSRFSEVRDAIFAHPYQKIWGGNGESPFPVYQVTLASILQGILPFGKPHLFRHAVERAVDSHADLRWGEGGRGVRRLLHPNGICLTGLWEITENTDYSGYFSEGSKGLLIGRYSTCCSETRRGYTRSLALVGKLYPTIDPNHPERLRTANFFTQEDLGGERTDSINDVELRNAPDTRAWRRGMGLPILLLEGIFFLFVDNKPTIRQLYQIAELGKSESEPTRAPEFMRLKVASNHARVAGEDLDFRDEIMAQIYDQGDPNPKRQLVFNIEVTDEGSTYGTPAYERREFRNWRDIGTLTFDNAVASYNGDFVIHFNHPTWREDRNDPATATRVNEHKRKR